MKGLTINQLVLNADAQGEPVELLACLQSTGAGMRDVHNINKGAKLVLVQRDYFEASYKFGRDLILKNVNGDNWQAWSGNWGNGEYDD